MKHLALALLTVLTLSHSARAEKFPEEKPIPMPKASQVVSLRCDSGILSDLFGTPRFADVSFNHATGVFTVDEYVRIVQQSALALLAPNVSGSFVVNDQAGTLTSIPAKNEEVRISFNLRKKSCSLIYVDRNVKSLHASISAIGDWGSEFYLPYGRK